MAPTYRVFKRRTWKRVNGQWQPHATRGTTIRTGLSLEEARALCKEGPANMARDAGREYRHLPFFEFTAE